MLSLPSAGLSCLMGRPFGRTCASALILRRPILAKLWVSGVNVKRALGMWLFLQFGNKRAISRP
jgi:hypothetical protein